MKNTKGQTPPDSPLSKVKITRLLHGSRSSDSDSSNTDQFITRAEKIKKTKFPHSEKGKVIIKSKNDGIGFREKIDSEQIEYLPKNTDTVVRTIRECNTIVNKIYCYKRMKDDYDFLKENMKFLKFIFVCTTVGFIILAASEYEHDTSYVFTVGFSILMLSILVTFVVAFAAFFKTRKYINLYKELEDQVSEYITKQNRSLERSREKFILGPEIKWLEYHFKHA